MIIEFELIGEGFSRPYEINFSSFSTIKVACFTFERAANMNAMPIQ
jgi:hypothetical protein